MATEREDDAPSLLRLTLAWSVHAYTAFGSVLGFYALISAFRQDYRSCFLALAVALFVDASDGTLARAAKVKQSIPWFDGELLDNIVDYLTYVVVPAAILVQPGILPEGWQGAAGLVLLASAYGFSRKDAKGFVEHYFQGFPSYWNVLAFYYVVLGTAAWVNLAFLLAFVVLVFVPMRWLYPSRMESQRAMAIGLGALWGAMGMTVVWQFPQHSSLLAWASLFYPIYYTVASVLYHRRTA